MSEPSEFDYLSDEMQEYIINLENEKERQAQRIEELEQERRWIPVRDWPPEVGWHRVITNNGTEQIRQYVRVPDRDIHYWDVKENESIMMYTYPTLPQPPEEEE